MHIRIENQLPVAELSLQYLNHEPIELNHVLIDTGSAATVLDTDCASEAGVMFHVLSGKPAKMYGVGGQSEWVYQQLVHDISFNHVTFPSFTIQLGDIQGQYGFDAILGTDFLKRYGLTLDFGLIS